MTSLQKLNEKIIWRPFFFFFHETTETQPNTDYFAFRQLSQVERVIYDHLVWYIY